MRSNWLRKQIKAYLKCFMKPTNLITIPKVVKKPSGKRILVLAPHFDDDVIGCGGTLYKHTQAGDMVTIVYLTDGRLGDPTNPDKDMVTQLRKEEAREATSILGIKDLIFLDQRETNLIVTDELVNCLSKIFKQFGPDLVYLPSFLDNHIDHLALNRVFLEVAGKLKIKFNICAYEVWTPLLPNIIVDIGDIILIKEEALKQYKTQIKQVDYVATTIALNRYRSITNHKGRSFCEAFFFCSLREYVSIILLPVSPLVWQPQ